MPVHIVRGFGDALDDNHQTRYRGFVVNLSLDHVAKPLLGPEVVPCLGVYQ